MQTHPERGRVGRFGFYLSPHKLALKRLSFALFILNVLLFILIVADGVFTPAPTEQHGLAKRFYIAEGDYNWKELEKFAMVICAGLIGLVLSMMILYLVNGVIKCWAEGRDFTLLTVQESGNENRDSQKLETNAWRLFSFVVCLLVGLVLITSTTGLAYIALTTALVVMATVALHKTADCHFELTNIRRSGHGILVKAIVLISAVGLALADKVHWAPSVAWLTVMVYPYLIRWAASGYEYGFAAGRTGTTALSDHPRGGYQPIVDAADDGLRADNLHRHEDLIGMGGRFSPSPSRFAVGSDVSTVSADENMEAGEDVANNRPGRA